MDNPMQDAVLALPEANAPGEWTERNKEKLAKAKESQQVVDSVLIKLVESKNQLCGIPIPWMCMSK